MSPVAFSRKYMGVGAYFTDNPGKSHGEILQETYSDCPSNM